jgi:hypothetical protein
MLALQISHGSMVQLKNEMKQLQEEQQEVLEYTITWTTIGIPTVYTCTKI